MVEAHEPWFHGDLLAFLAAAFRYGHCLGSLSPVIDFETRYSYRKLVAGKKNGIGDVLAVDERPVPGAEISNRQCSLQIIKLAVDSARPRIAHPNIGLGTTTDDGRKLLHGESKLRKTRIDCAEFHFHESVDVLRGRKRSGIPVRPSYDFDFVDYLRHPSHARHGFLGKLLVIEAGQMAS